MRNRRSILYVAAITLVATLGGLLFGYDTAVISGAEQAIEVYLIDSLDLGSFAHGITVSSALIGCIIGGIISGFFSNRIGRKNTLLLAAVLFILSALGSAYPEFLFFKAGEPTFGVLMMLNVYRILGESVSGWRLRRLPPISEKSLPRIFAEGWFPGINSPSSLGSW